MSADVSPFERDMTMSADNLIEDFALGIMRVCDDNLRINKQAHGDDYPEGDEIDYNDLYQSCVELFLPLSTKEDATFHNDGFLLLAI